MELVCLRICGKGQDPVQEIRSDIWWPLVGRGFSNILPKYTLLGTNVLLMEEILHPWIGSLSHNLRVLYIPGGAGFFHQQYSLLKIRLKMFSFSLGGICSFCWRVPIDNQGDLQTCSARKNHTSPFWVIKIDNCLVGGFNPSEKYYSNWIISRGRDEKKSIWNHQLVVDILRGKHRKVRSFKKQLFVGLKKNQVEGLKLTSTTAT